MRKSQKPERWHTCSSRFAESWEGCTTTANGALGVEGVAKHSPLSSLAEEEGPSYSPAFVCSIRVAQFFLSSSVGQECWIPFFPALISKMKPYREPLLQHGQLTITDITHLFFITMASMESNGTTSVGSACLFWPFSYNCVNKRDGKKHSHSGASKID